MICRQSIIMIGDHDKNHVLTGSGKTGLLGCTDDYILQLRDHLAIASLQLFTFT